MKIVLPGATIGLLGGGQNARMFAFAARSMGYGVQLYSPDSDDVARPVCDGGVYRELDDLISIRQFASSADVLTVAGTGVPLQAIEAAADVGLMRPSSAAFETLLSYPRSEVAAEVEFCLVAARGIRRECAFYSPIALDRQEGVVDIARMPAAIGSRMASQAANTAREILEKAEFVGVAGVEFLVSGTHELTTSAVTPYSHDSGFLTADSCVTSQFEQHVRAVCGLPLGRTDLMKPSAMANLSSAIWEASDPDWVSALLLPEVKLYIHGPRSGHLTATATSATLAKQIVKAARLALTRP